LFGAATFNARPTAVCGAVCGAVCRSQVRYGGRRPSYIIELRGRPGIDGVRALRAAL